MYEKINNTYPRLLADLRCATCGKLLARGMGYSLQIKCRSCKTLNHFHGHEPTDRTPESVGKNACGNQL